MSVFDIEQEKKQPVEEGTKIEIGGVSGKLFVERTYPWEEPSISMGLFFLKDIQNPDIFDKQLILDIEECKGIYREFKEIVKDNTGEFSFFNLFGILQKIALL